ncbi:heavy-metal-associated domain-containing protein [Rhizohabitans arisaemae]|uniref:heavy-metal-associated domain-containing protein n=1 Tax=Rhizohabitans arisaemae TaxID=2720610 RepID=UPI0024B10A98|nr:heavy-metal-associated domain-containing protein [Rhizohabitans arisaemae]
MSESQFTVSGMTCGHCVMSVKEEVGQIPGVKEIDVDLASGTVKVVSEGPVDTDAVRAAVTEAGYQLVG